MDWTTGMQKAIDYIEEHITEEIDYETVAAQSFSSSHHFQRVFSILCGFTLGEYIRNRRLALAGAELARGAKKVIDIALKYGYESPDSFAKAFQKFHGIVPSKAHLDGSTLRSFSRLAFKFSLEGGNSMNYRIEEKNEMILTGYKKHFSGTPAERHEQENEFFITTRAKQYILHGLARDCDTTYCVMDNFDDEGYDFYIASNLDKWHTENIDKVLGADAEHFDFEKIIVSKGLYLICETERCVYPTTLIEKLRKSVVSEWLPSSGYELADAPEVSVTHWYYEYGNKELSNQRYIELWLPIINK